MARFVSLGAGNWQCTAYQKASGAPAADQGRAFSSYGDGSDGSVTISSGTTYLARDSFYASLTINGTGQIRPNGYRLFVRDVLDLSNAPASAITANGSDGSLQTAGSQLASSTCGGGSAGSAGAAGGTTNGGNATASSSSSNSGGGKGSQGIVGGGGGSGTGGSGVAVGTFIAVSSVPRTPQEIFLTLRTLLINGGGGGSGGGGGGGDGTAGGNGGGGGGGSGVLDIRSRIVKRGASTPVGCISANGGLGAAGISAVAGVRGGGGGGGGGGAGVIRLMFDSLQGTAAINMLTANGGNSGANGNGFGGGLGANGSGVVSSKGGRIILLCMDAGTWTELDGTGLQGTSGGVNSGTTAGVSAIGGLAQVSL